MAILLFHQSNLKITLMLGVRCKSSDRLPEECFCWDGVCSHPYMTYYHILTTLVTLGQDNIVVKRKIILWPGKTLLKHSYLSETDRADPNIIQIVGMEPPFPFEEEIAGIKHM